VKQGKEIRVKTEQVEELQVELGSLRGECKAHVDNEKRLNYASTNQKKVLRENVKKIED